MADNRCLFLICGWFLFFSHKLVADPQSGMLTAQNKEFVHRKSVYSRNNLRPNDFLDTLGTFRTQTTYQTNPSLPARLYIWVSNGLNMTDNLLVERDWILMYDSVTALQLPLAILRRPYSRRRVMDSISYMKSAGASRDAIHRIIADYTIRNNALVKPDAPVFCNMCDRGCVL